MERFAREDPKIRRHLDVMRRKDLLEQVLKEVENLRQIGERERRYPRQSPPTTKQGKGWSLF